jgi:hypothetical protein
MNLNFRFKPFENLAVLEGFKLKVQVMKKTSPKVFSRWRR